MPVSPRSWCEERISLLELGYRKKNKKTAWIDRPGTVYVPSLKIIYL